MPAELVSQLATLLTTCCFYFGYTVLMIHYCLQSGPLGVCSQCVASAGLTKGRPCAYRQPFHTCWHVAYGVEMFACTHTQLLCTGCESFASRVPVFARWPSAAGRMCVSGARVH